MSFRRAARKDDNHTEIVKEFRRLGWSVLDVAQLKNCCDLVVAKDGYTVAVEIKDGKKPPSKRRLSQGEVKFRDDWKGIYFLVMSKEDVQLLDDVSVKVEIG